MTMQTIASLRSKLLGRPGLPSGLVYLVMLLLFTQACALLMNQPAAYWHNRQYASTDWPFSFLARVGPLPFLVITSLYLIIAGLLLKNLRALPGLFLAAVLGLLHSVALFRTTICGFSALYEAHSAWACHTYRFAPLILFFILFGLMLSMDYLPEPWVHWGKKILIPLGRIWIFLMIYAVVRAAYLPPSPWKPLTPSHAPGPRSMAAIAYDTRRERAVLFGGITHWDGEQWVYDNSTWEWDGQDWQQMETPLAPPGRILHAMAFDEGSGRVILYGGKNSSGNLADLWAWDGVTWHRLCPVCNPAARFGHKMIFDVGRQKIVVYGGQDGKIGFNQAWTWNGEKWDYFQFENTAPAVYNAPIAYDQSHKRIISFMGREWGGTWIWEGSQWHKLHSTIKPPLRDEATLVYDPINDATVLFGGLNDDETMFNDTWILHGEKWLKLNTRSAPPERYKALSFYDPVRRTIILYGGEIMGFIYSDMWELKLP